MNKRGDSMFAGFNLIFIILFLFFFVGMYAYLSGYRERAYVWEEFYAKEISRLIDSGSVGNEYYIDISPATFAATKNKVPRLEDIILIDNVNNEVIVKLRQSGDSRFKYFSNLDVVDWKVEILESGSSVNRFYFRLEDPNE